MSFLTMIHVSTLVNVFIKGQGMPNGHPWLNIIACTL